MRIIHTSDWHIGHRLYGQYRHEEHRLFFDWLHQQLIENQIDALIIAGDVFDTHNPSAESTRLYYNFLMRVHQSLPDLTTIVIGGNHDSAQRLDAPREVLKSLNVRVIGGLPNHHSPEWEEIYVKIRSSKGEEAWVAAVPFLRASDLPIKTTEDEDRMINGVREVYHWVLDKIEERLTEDQALILTGHCEMTSGLLSLDSERRPRGYGDQTLPTDVFTPKDTRTPSYVALGHLHLAQEISERSHIRYSGAPLAFSIAERDYPHQVVCIELDGAKVSKITPILVPEEIKVKMLRIPKRDHIDETVNQTSFDEVIKELKRLPELDETEPEWRRPLLQVNIHSEHPDPNIKIKVLKILKYKHVRLAKISISYPKSVQYESGAELAPKTYLSDIDPSAIFSARWKSRCGEVPPDDQLKLFEELIDEARIELSDEM